MLSPNVLWALCKKLASCPPFEVAPRFFGKSVDPSFRLYRNAVLFEEVPNVEMIPLYSSIEIKLVEVNSREY